MEEGRILLISDWWTSISLFCVLNNLTTPHPIGWFHFDLTSKTTNKLFQPTCNQTQMAGKAFDIRLIPEFHGVSSDHTVSEWLEQVELVCKMCDVDNVECVLPLRLRGGALLVYQRLTRDQREDLQQIKQALLVAFAPDPFVAFDTFVLHCLHPGETVDEYLGDLQDLARLIKENTSDRWLSCAFMSGLPGPVRRQLRGSSRMEHMFTWLQVWG